MKDDNKISLIYHMENLLNNINIYKDNKYDNINIFIIIIILNKNFKKVKKIII
jgi:hypothetical protein